MLTSEFLNLLQEEGKSLRFEYQDEKFIPKSYHITEIKNVHIESVDCGGYAHTEKQTVVQLWVSETEKADDYMSLKTARKIFDLVNKVRPFHKDAPIFFEWGNKDIQTSIYTVDAVQKNDTHLTIKMSVPATRCRPKVEDMSHQLQLVGCCSDNSNCC